jgi:hypothetical protein
MIYDDDGRVLCYSTAAFVPMVLSRLLNAFFVFVSLDVGFGLSFTMCSFPCW